MKKLFQRSDKILLFLTIVLFIFGLLMIQSASSMESYMRYGNSPYYYFWKQFFALISGVVLYLIFSFIPTKFYKNKGNWIMIISISVLIYVLINGDIAKGAKSWIDLGFLSIQPSELIKVVIIVYLAIYYENNNKRIDDINVLIFPFVYIAIICGLIFFQPDLGTMGILLILAFLIFYAIPIDKTYKTKLNKVIAGIAVVIVLFALTSGNVLKKYQMDRILGFIDPCSRYEEDTGYQLCNSFIAFNNGGLTGRGIGGSTQKYLYLPESYTDFIFPIIVEEWGLIVGIIIIIMYMIILFRLYKISKNSVTFRGSVIAYGVMVYIFLHITINFIGVMGLGPLTGVPLPFLSYGGSYTWSLMVALALAQRVQIETNTQKILDKKKRNN